MSQHLEKMFLQNPKWRLEMLLLSNFQFKTQFNCSFIYI